MRRATGICETCKFWAIHAKEIRGPRQGFGLKGYCHKHLLLTGDTGHCAFHEGTKKKPVLDEAFA